MKAQILFFKGSSFLSRCIQWRTYSPYSHVAVRIGDEIYEALMDKWVVCTHADQQSPESLTDVIEIEISDYRLAQWLKFLIWEIGNKYDFWGIFWFLGRPKNRSLDHSWFCSELVWEFLYTCEEMERLQYPLSPWDLFKHLYALQISKKI